MTLGSELTTVCCTGDQPDAVKTYEVPSLDASPGVPQYYAFCLDAGGGIATKITVEADSDDEALARVRTWQNAHGIDLWERGRLLASFPPYPADGEAAEGLASVTPIIVPET